MTDTDLAAEVATARAVALELRELLTELRHERTQAQDMVRRAIGAEVTERLQEALAEVEDDVLAYIRAQLEPAAPEPELCGVLVPPIPGLTNPFLCEVPRPCHRPGHEQGRDGR